nr:MAG: major capsid protein [Microvirus sp.]
MSIYKNVGSIQPGMTMFDLSYEKKFTCDMGQLIPIMCDEVVPGDIFTIGNQAVIRFQPLVAPVLHEINMFVHYFFVPYRILWEDWEDFISGGVLGNEVPEIPTWNPNINGLGSLWDFLGFPINVKPQGAYPISFPREAYNFIYNEYYRDETLINDIPLQAELILNRSWEKDYFTSALPFQQRGTAPALPISGSTHATWVGSQVVEAIGAQNMQFSSTAGDTRAYIPNNTQARANALNFMNANVVSFGTANTFDVSDIRLAFQIQKWMERNARAGARYTEFLKAHFGVSPKDERLQRPEYIGGSKSPVIISEVLQTSSTDATTPQGNLAGHGMSVSDSYCGKYRATEFGLIMGIMSVMPKPSYSQGINRQWLRRTKYDFYFPEFANLSEQAIIKAEICAVHNNTEHNEAVFGFQGRYDEMRTKPNMICSEMRSTYDYWHLARQFDTANPPALNQAFITCSPRKDIFAVENVPGLIVSFANLIKAYRPIPLMSEPGLIDHN